MEIYLNIISDTFNDIVPCIFLCGDSIWFTISTIHSFVLFPSLCCLFSIQSLNLTEVINLHGEMRNIFITLSSSLFLYVCQFRKLENMALYSFLPFVILYKTFSFHILSLWYLPLHSFAESNCFCYFPLLQLFKKWLKFLEALRIKR